MNCKRGVLNANQPFIDAADRAAISDSADGICRCKNRSVEGTGLLYSMGIAVGMHVVFLLLNALFRKALKLDPSGHA